MGDLLLRLYRRRPFGYVIGVLASFLLGFLLMAAITLALYARMLGLPAGAYATMLLCTSIGLVLGGAVVIWWAARRELVIRWARGKIPASRAADVWSGLVGLPGRQVIRTAIVDIPITLGILLVLADRVVRADALEVVDLVIGLALTALFLLVLLFSGGDVVLRPVRLELDPLLPAGFHPASGGASVRLRLMLEIFSIASFSGILTATLLLPAGAGAESLLFAMLGSLATSAPIVLVVGGLMSSRVLAPIRELLQGTRQVAGGNLGARVPLTTSDEHLTLADNFNTMVAGLRERERLHSAVGAYIDPAIAERVMYEGAQISGEEADVTVMFVDIVGFTSLAEGAIPEEVVSDLNDFFEIVIPAIERHGGHANKLLGDGLMAVFGVPSALEDHADRALAAAREIQAGLAVRYEGQLRAGIGLNSGTVVVGSMGGGAKLDYTIIGDAVNVAARVEAYTRQTGDGILVTDATRDLLTAADGLEARGSESLKGRAVPVGLWAS